MPFDGLPENVRDTVHELVSKHDNDLLEAETLSPQGSAQGWLLPEGHEVAYVILPSQNPFSEPSIRRTLNGGEPPSSISLSKTGDTLGIPTDNFVF